jgi:hypothetical protein
MIAVRVADENDLDVLELEAELDQRHGVFEVRIDQNVALIGSDQERGVVGSADE